MKVIKKQEGIIEISRLVAFLSFLFGSIILLFFYVTKSSGFMLFGLFYVVIAAILNLTFLVGLITKYYHYKLERKRVLVSILIILINIPIAYTYYLIAMYILSQVID